VTYVRVFASRRVIRTREVPRANALVFVVAIARVAIVVVVVDV